MLAQQRGGGGCAAPATADEISDGGGAAAALIIQEMEEKRTRSLACSLARSRPLFYRGRLEAETASLSLSLVRILPLPSFLPVDHRPMRDRPSYCRNAAAGYDRGGYYTFGFG